MGRAEVIEQALRLPVAERGEVIRELIRSLESEGGEGDPTVVEAAWAEEIGKGWSGSDAEGAKGIPAAVTMERARRAVEQERQGAALGYRDGIVTMVVTFTDEADHEMIEAARWYERQAGIGAAFLDCVWERVREISESPRRFPRIPLRGGRDIRSAEVRRALCGPFAYSLVYRVMPGEIRVLAVAPVNRRPGYWRDRAGS